MIHNMSKAALVNESANRVFVEDSKLNMDKIVEHCEVLYTFLTTLDSCKLINVDEQYIENMLKKVWGQVNPDPIVLKFYFYSSISIKCNIV